MTNANEILERILLNMKYDSIKTLSENKKTIFEEAEVDDGWIETYDIIGRPLRFKGRQITTVNEIKNNFSTNPEVISKSEIGTANRFMADAVLGMSNIIMPNERFWNEYMPKFKEFLNSTNVYAPFHVAAKDKSGSEKNYYLTFYCQTWNRIAKSKYWNPDKKKYTYTPELVRSSDFDYTYECNKNNLFSLGYYGPGTNVDPRWLNTYDKHLPKQVVKPKPVVKPKKTMTVDEQKQWCSDHGKVWDDETNTCIGEYINIFADSADFERKGEEILKSKVGGGETKGDGSISGEKDGEKDGKIDGKFRITLSGG